MTRTKLQRPGRKQASLGIYGHENFFSNFEGMHVRKENKKSSILHKAEGGQNQPKLRVVYSET